MCSTSTHCVCLCVCVCVYVACLPDVPAHPKHPTDTCCTYMTSDSSQTGLTKTAPRFPGCSRLETSGYMCSGCRQHRGPHTFVGRGHCPLTFIKREGGGGGVV